MVPGAPRPRRRLRLLAIYLTAGLLGALVGVSTIILGVGYVPPPAPPGTVVLDNVQVNYFYLNGTPQIFGGNQQELCPLCPLTLTGGTTFTAGTLLEQILPGGNSTTLWFNATSPVPFEEWSCSWTGARPPGWPPTGCPFTTDWHGGAQTIEVGANSSASITYPLTLSIPDPAPSLPGGFYVQLVFAVKMSPLPPSG